MKTPIDLIVIGAGGRGATYARFAEAYPGRARIVAVAEPRPDAREALARQHGVEPARCFASWEDVAARPKFADAALICTQDAMHEGPAVALAGLGYPLLLEKPMAPTEESCRRIVDAARRSGTAFSVCHVLRYTALTRKIREIIASGRIGRIASVQHLEGVGYWHYAHSFVRGNWRNEKESSFMLLAKACHDLDWLRHIVDAPCLRVQSFGSLRHFHRGNRPAGAAERCADCPEAVEANCPYSALRIYLGGGIKATLDVWPINVVSSVPTREAVLEALKTGPYGRCVFACDNDVVDHQVVNLEFEGGRSASFTMTGLTGEVGRKTRIFGTLGCLEAANGKIWATDFLTGITEEIDSGVPDDGGILTGHGGGDGGLMEAFVRALETGDRSHILSGPEETLESHLMVFAAERSRRLGTVETIRR